MSDKLAKSRQAVLSSIRGDTYLYETLPTPLQTPTSATFIFLHGAGEASTKRVLPLIDALGEMGHRAVGFDAFGHGRSGGRLSDESLESRTRQAEEVLNTLKVQRAVLVGFSMGGQIACNLLHRVSGIIGIALCSPAAYSKDSSDLQFDQAFTDCIRKKDSWITSTAFHALATFGGSALLCLPGEDDVIPRGVSDRYREAVMSPHRKTAVVVRFGEADHQLGSWLRAHARDRNRFVAALDFLARQQTLADL